MINLKTKIDNYRREIELVISGLDRFKIIMQAIADVKKMAIQAEVQYRLYQVLLIKFSKKNYFKQIMITLAL